MLRDFQALVSMGFLPKEMPLIFQSRDFASYVSAGIHPPLDTSWTGCSDFNLGRAGGLRRPLSIMNPKGFVRVARAIEAEWTDIQNIYGQDRVTNTSPHEVDTGFWERYFRHGTTFHDRPSLRMRLGHKARFVVRADFSQCYSSIYTHSLAWAFETKELVKTNPRNSAWRGSVNGQFLVPAGGQQKSPPFTRSLLLF